MHAKEHVLELRIIDVSPRRLELLKNELVDKLIDIKDDIRTGNRCDQPMSEDTDWGFRLDGKDI